MKQVHLFEMMNFNDLPPLIPSDTDPVILETKRDHLQKPNPIFQEIEPLYSPISTPDRDYHDLENHYNSTRYTNGGNEKHPSLKFNSIHQRHYEDGYLAEEMLSQFSEDCQIKKVCSCYAVVRKDCGIPHSNIFQFGSRNTLPGVVDVDELGSDILHRSKMHPKRQVDRFWNAKLQLDSNKQNEKFLEYSRHFLLQIRKFISKLNQAIASELNYVKNLDVIKLKYISFVKNSKRNFGSSDSMYDSSASALFNAEEIESHLNEEMSIRPPKLGKVYSELQIHFKAWDDIMRKWQGYRQDLDSEMLCHLVAFQKRIKTYQLQMLSLTQKLIEARLRSFACCVTIRSKNDEQEKEWDYVLGAGSLKRLCKLLDVYNKLLRNRTEKEKSSTNLNQFQSRPHCVVDVLSTSKENPQKQPPFLKSNSSLLFFTVARISNILAGPAKDDLASTLLEVLSIIQRNKPDPFDGFNEELSAKKNPNLVKVDWGKADDEVEIDEDQVITHIAGHEVPNISNTTLSDESLSAIKQLLYAQGRFIVSFINSLAANTCLLRGKSAIKTPRSITSSQALNDDVSAVSSDDEASSVASSSFFSQLSAAGTFTSRKRKTVLWRDSWDQEAVNSYSKSYMACLVTQGPAETLQFHAVKSDSSVIVVSNCRDDDSGVNDQAVSHLFATQHPAKSFRPRFWSDAHTLTLDASIANLMTLEILPADVLESLLESTQAFIVEKALEKWDSNMCMALGVSTKDKCGSLPIEGMASLSKTAWTYAKAIHCLMFIMARYHKRDVAARQALLRLEATLNSFFRWSHGKIQQFTASWSLRQLLQVYLGDLTQLTTLGLDCLPLVEKCHNLIESHRMEDPAALQLATKHLRNIDATITDMQSLSGDCMRMYIKKCAFLCKKAIEASFPSRKFWRQNNLTDHSSASSYMETSVKSVIKPICSAVTVLDARSQLAAVPPVMTTMLEAVIRLILQKNIRFSVQGAIQLQRDFEYVVEFVCSEEAGMCVEVRRTAPHLKSVNRAMCVAKTLQRTDMMTTTKSGKTGYEKSQRRNNAVRNLSPTNEEFGEGFDDDDWPAREKELLALRISDKEAKQRNKKWFSLPCSDEVLD